MNQLKYIRRLEKQTLKKAREQEKRRVAKENKEIQQRQLLEELEKEFEIVSKIKWTNNGPDDTDFLNAVTSESIIEIEKVLQEKDGYSQEALNKSLMLAANNGQKLILILLLRYGADTNWTDENGNTSLMICAEKGFLDMAKILLANSADANKTNSSGNTALILSIKPSGAADMARLLVSSSNVNVKNIDGLTALSKAVDSRDLETIYILISNGADQNDVINDETVQELSTKKGILQYINLFSDCKNLKEPPLIAALKYRDPSLLETILTYESNAIKQGTVDGCTALEAFFDLILKEKRDFTFVDKSIVKLLIAKGVSINDDFFKIRRQYSVNVSLLVKAVQIGDTDIVRWLCIKGLPVNENVRYNSFTPLMMASKCGFTEITKFLLSQGADIKVKGCEGTAFEVALKYNHLGCAKILLEEKAKKGLVEAYKLAIECKQLCLVEHLDERFTLDTKENRFLEWAIDSGSIDIFRYLINKDIMCINTSFVIKHYSRSRYVEYSSPLHVAVMKEKPDFINVVLQSKADINIKDGYGNTVLFYASGKRRSDILILLLESGSNVNITNNFGKTPLFYAVENTDIMNVTLLLKSGASVNISDSAGETPLLKAIQCRSVEIMSLLIEWKADTSSITETGGTYITELFKSCYYDSDLENFIEILQVLLKENIDINKQYVYGDTALTIACSIGDSMTEAVKILLEHGADVNLINTENESPISISFRSHNLDIIKMLLQKKAKFYPLTLCQQGVHWFVGNNVSELIPLALGNGVFPFVLKSYESIDPFFPKTLDDKIDFSPLSLALHVKRLDIVKYLIQVRFLTKYDVSDLLKTDIFQETILAAEQGNIFNNLLSLSTLSFVQVSEMLGATLDREEKVNQLPLPPKIKQQLLFRSLNVPIQLS